MAMLISKFHRMIQNKVVWLVISIVVVVSFAMWVGSVSIWSALSGGGGQKQGGGSLGMLGGKPVPVDEYQRAYGSIYLVTSLNLPQNMSITEEIRKRMVEAAWGRLAALREARKLGLNATPDEIDTSIQQIQYFQQNQGQFNNAIYRQFIEKVLPRFGFTEVAFERHIEDEVILRKVRDLLLRTYMVSPAELQRMFGMMSDAFKIEYAVLKPAAVSNAVKVSRDDAKRFFEKNAERFTQPEKIKVEYVRFAVAPFVPQVKVDPAEVEAYYNDNLTEFENDTPLTNAASLATNALGAATNAAPAATGAVALATNAAAAATNDVLSRYKAFESVKQEIVNKLIQRAATDQALEKADGFVRLVLPDRDGKALTLAEAARQPGFGLLLEEAGPFAEYDDLPGIDAGMTFNRAAFRCTMDPENRVSEPIRGSNFVYVISLAERIPERVPAFDEVEKEVMPYAQRDAVREAVLARAGEIRKAAEEALAKSNTFASALSPFGLKPVPTEEFTAAIGPTTNDYSSILMRGILTLNQGEISEPLPSGEEMLLAYVVQRKPGDPTTFASMRGDMEQELRGRSLRMIYEGWQAQLLKTGDFKPGNMASDSLEESPEDAASSTNAVPTNAPPAVTPH